jgi:hypothetical protein
VHAALRACPEVLHCDQLNDETAFRLDALSSIDCANPSRDCRVVSADEIRRCK